MPDSKENKLPQQPPDSKPPTLNDAGVGQETTAVKYWDLSLTKTLGDQDEQWPREKPLTHVMTDGSHEQPEGEAAL